MSGEQIRDYVNNQQLDTEAKGSNSEGSKVAAKQKSYRQKPCETPENLIPRIASLPISAAQHFTSIHMTRLPPAGPKKAFSDALNLTEVSDPASMPAVGVRLTHEQVWSSRGIALGDVIHSITLAPGEVTQVAIDDWHRRESARAEESTRQDDSVAAEDQRHRSIEEIQTSSVREHQFGASSAMSASVSAESGLLQSLEGPAWGVNATTSNSINYSQGDKSIAMDQNQAINEITQRASQASRTRRASVVRETSQSEGEAITTRVVANYNHAHALTMMYFELLEIHNLTTKVVDAERLIYLPMAQTEITHDHLKRFRGPLAKAAELRGDKDLANLTRDAQAEIEQRSVIEVGKAKNLIEVWKDKGSGAQKDLSFWRVDAGDGWHSLGDIAVRGYEKPGNNMIRVMKTADGHDDALAEPAAFEPIWDDKNSGCEGQNIRIFRIVPKPNYVALGMAIMPNYQEQPKPENYRCLRADLATKAAIGPELWAFEKAKATPLNVYEVSTREPSNGWIGTFLVTTDKNPPNENAGELHCFKLDDSNIKAHEQSEVLKRLNAQQLYYNQAMWLSLRPDALLAKLRDLQWCEDPEKIASQPSLAELIDPTPVAITGNYIAYRWHFPENEAQERKEFLARFIPVPGDTNSELVHVSTVGVPTGGIFGEAVLGQAVSAEKIDLTRFWKWQDSPIPILPTQIAQMQAGGKARDIDTSTGKLAETAATLAPMTALPDPSGFSAMSQMMASNIFRDMSGSEVVKELAKAATEHSAASAEHASEMASQNLQHYLSSMKDFAEMALQSGIMDTTTLGGLKNEAATEVGAETEAGAEGLVDGVLPLVEAAAL